MLTELRIENFAIIDRLELHFKPGLITFTGETGAGKSIIIDAVEMLLGGRAEATMIRSEATRSNIEATFQIKPEIREQVHTVLEREALLDDHDTFTLGREIRTEGRSVGRVNGRVVNLAVLRELGELLVDVHGQSEHLSLLRVRQHIDLLDRFAGVESELSIYQQTFHELHGLRKELKELRLAEDEAARRLDLLAYQANEIESARLKPGEDDTLVAERTRLVNAESLAKLAQQALIGLDEGSPESPSVIDLLGPVEDALNDLARIDSRQENLAEMLRAAFTNLTEISRDLRSYIEEIEFNPARLDEVEERLNLIHNLKRKYGNSIPAVLDFAVKNRQQIETITHAGERIIELEAQEMVLLAELGTRGMVLSQKRRQAAGQLQINIESELADLRMEGARFEVDFQERSDPDGAQLPDGRQLAFDSTGLEHVEFMIAPNPGEGLKPLVKIASGGETSRLMLALKNVLASADHIPTLIFDEIDQGIGGRVGTIVGHKLRRLARRHQVLCVTHLPQLAAFGEQHLQVNKHIENERTITEVTELSDEDRVAELAQMLGEVSQGTLHSAKDMLQNAQTMNATEN